MNVTKKFLDAIKDAHNILISTHLIPDADGIGSEVALCMALADMGKNSICVNEEPLLARYKYLDPKDVVIGFEDFTKLNHKDQKKIDLVIIVDTNVISRAGEKITNFALAQNCPILYIDHHPCAQNISDLHCIDISAAATGQLVGYLIKAMGVKFYKELALPLYTAILIDTSSFRYPTVSAKTHEIVAELMAAGVESPSAYNGIYGTKSIQHMHLLGKVLATAQTTSNGEIAWIILHQKDMQEHDTDIEDTHAFINHLLILDNIKVACMFRDDGHQLKVSFRSTGAYDVGLMAQKLGGGGHSHSAAALFERTKSDDLQATIKEIISKIEKQIQEC
jgi:phosphoesterase RecJ-like protein